MGSKRTYTLKPGRHQFAPGSAAEHSSGAMSNEEAEWYLKRYPHINALFISNDSEDLTGEEQPASAILSPSGSDHHDKIETESAEGIAE